VSEEDFEAQDLDLQRRLDAAFSQTRPRRGYEDTLWVSLESRRRAPWRQRAVLRNRVPHGAWPALAGLAAVLVLTVAILPFLVRGHPGGSATSSSSAGSGSGPQFGAPRTAPQASAAVLMPPRQFGLLPTPRLANPIRSTSQASAPVPYYGPATLSVIAGMAGLPRTLPVLRFSEPSTRQAAAMAKAYDAQAVAVSSQPFREPRAQITASRADPGGAAPLPDDAALAAADAFLAGRNVALPWSHLPEVVDQGTLALVHYVRQFQVEGNRAVTQVDQMGAHAGADVAVRPDGTVVQATVPLQLPLQSSAYPSRASENVAQDALRVPPPSSIGFSPAPEVQLNNAELVYIAVLAGAYGYFEPAVLFTGAFTVDGTQYEKRVLVPALAASHLR
jgi:hypothetical protein